MANRIVLKNANSLLGYMGVNAYSPPNISAYDRAPTTDDYKGFFIGDMWIDQSASPINIYMLVAREKDPVTKVIVAEWLSITSSMSLPVDVPDGGTGLISLTDGAVLVGDGTNDVELVGPGDDGQLLIAATGLSPAWAYLTSTGGTVTITTGPSSINIEGGSSVPIQFDADTGSAVPTLGILDVLGGTSMVTSAAGSTVTIDVDTDVAVSYATDSGSAVPASNTITFAGGTGIDTSGTSSTVTIDASTDVAMSYVTDSGTAVPVANSITIAGGTNVSTAGAGNTVTITGSLGGGAGASISCFNTFSGTGTSYLNVTGDGTIWTVVFNPAPIATSWFDVGGDFDGTSTFTAPQTGIYYFETCWIFTKTTGYTAFTSAVLSIECAATGDTAKTYMNPAHFNDLSYYDMSIYRSKVMSLTIGDTVQVKIQVSGGTKTVHNSPGKETYFSGYLVA